MFILPTVVVVFLYFWNKKVDARRQKQEEIINTMADIIDIKDVSIQKLRKEKP